MDSQPEMNGDQGGFRGGDRSRGGFRGGRGGGGGGRGGGRGGSTRGNEERAPRQSGNRGQGDSGPGPRQGRGPESRVFDRLQSISQPTTDLPEKEKEVKKFTNHCRLFCGNVVGVTQEEFEKLFKEYGEVSDTFINSEKGFGFIKLDYRGNAEKAKNGLDGKMVKNKPLKVRFAAHGAALKVKNLSPWVSNELLNHAFSVFGEVEKAIHIVDARGKPTSEGIVEFAAKPSANIALKMCTEGSFFLTASYKPVIVELLTEDDNDEGYPEKTVPNRNQEFSKERGVGPRFAPPGSFEFEYAQSWKALYELERQKKEAVDAEMRHEREKLEEQMEYAKFEHETKTLEDQLRQRQAEREHVMREQQFRQQQREEQRRMEMERSNRLTEEMMSTIRSRVPNSRQYQDERFNDSRNGFNPDGNWNERDSSRGLADAQGVMENFQGGKRGNQEEQRHDGPVDREAIWAGGRDDEMSNKRMRWK